MQYTGHVEVPNPFRRTTLQWHEPGHPSRAASMYLRT